MIETRQGEDDVDFAGWFAEWGRLVNAVCEPEDGERISPAGSGNRAFDLKTKLIHTHASTFDDLRVQLALLKKLSWSESENGMLVKTILEGFDQIREVKDQGGSRSDR